MADAALTATVRARLDEFQNDIKRAESIVSDAIDKIEKNLGVKLDVGKQIEESVKKAEGRLQTRSVTLGNLISKGITAGINVAKKALDEFIESFKDIQSAARLTGQSIEKIGTITAAIGGKEVPQAIEQVATLLDRARRGEENALVKLLAENKQSVAAIKDAGDAWDRVARIIANAANQIQAREIAKSLGIGEDVADRLFKIGKGYDDMVAKSRAAGERIAEINEKSKQFAEALDTVIEKLKAMGVAIVQNLAGPFATFLEFLSKALTGLGLLADLGDAVTTRVFGVALPGAAKIQSAADQVNDLAGAVRKLNTEMTATERVSSAFDALSGKPAGGAAAPARTGPFSRPIPIATGGGGGGERDAFEREEDRIRKAIALRQAEVETIGQEAEARERARTVATLEEAAKRANTAAGLENTAVTEKQREAITKLADEMFKVVQRQSQLTFIVGELRNLGGLIANAFEDMIFNGKKFDEVLKNITQRLTSRALQMALEKLLVAAGSSLFSGGGGSLAGLFGGARQHGGPVSSGRPYLVGESGPELFVPQTSGSVIPNSATSGSNGFGSVNIQQTYDARGADPQAIARLELLIAADRRALPGRVMAAIGDARRRSAFK